MRTGRKGLGLLMGPSSHGADIIGQDQFLPFCLTGAPWRLTMTRESAHCLLKEGNTTFCLNEVQYNAKPGGCLQGCENHMIKNIAELTIMREGNKGPRKPWVSFEVIHDVLLTVGMNHERTDTLMLFVHHPTYCSCPLKILVIFDTFESLVFPAHSKVECLLPHCVHRTNLCKDINRWCHGNKASNFK